jgi:hypothetical protein
MILFRCINLTNGYRLSQVAEEEIIMVDTFINEMRSSYSFFCAISAAAQQQNLVIIDSQARQPVPWATVKMLHAAGGTIAKHSLK